MFADGPTNDFYTLAVAVTGLILAGWTLNQRVMKTIDRVADRMSLRIVRGLRRAAKALIAEYRGDSPAPQKRRKPPPPSTQLESNQH